MAEEIPIFISFPVSGVYTMQAGTYQLDFRLGDARLPTGTPIPMTGSIKAHEVCKGVFFQLSAACDVRIFNDYEVVYRGSIRANGFSINKIPFDAIHIDCLAQTTVQIIATTNEVPPHQ